MRLPAALSRIRTAPAAGLLALLVVGCAGPDERTDTPAPEPSAAIAVDVLRLTSSPVDRLVEATGTVLPRASVSPGTKILGRIASVPVREGDRIEEGALLAALESRDLEAAVRQAEAGLEMARAQLRNAEAQQARIAALHERGSATAKNLEDTDAALAVARAAVEQADAALDAARVTLGYASIRSPLTGWVVAKRVEPGDMATPGAPLFTVEDLSEAEIRVEVPESAIEHLTVGSTATLEILERELVAPVDRIVPSADPGSRTFDVRLLVPNEDGFLRSGLFVRARFAVDSEERLVVPASALVERGGLIGVLLVDESGDVPRARRTWVEVGRAAPSAAGPGRLVLSGLRDGDRVVVAPPPGLADGTPLEVRP